MSVVAVQRGARLIMTLLLSPYFAYIWLGRSDEERNVRFQLCSESLSLIPFRIGVLARRVFYAHALRACGSNLVTRLGVVFLYRDSRVGDNVFIGRSTSVGLVDIGSDALISHGVSLLSGRHHHGTADPGTHLNRQPGEVRRVRIGRDVWIGAGAIVMDDVGEGSVIGAGSVVVHGIPDHSIAVGNPARVVKSRIGVEANAPLSVSAGFAGNSEGKQ